MTKMTLNENFFGHLEQFVDGFVQENQFEVGVSDYTRGVILARGNKLPYEVFLFFKHTLRANFFTPLNLF